MTSKPLIGVISASVIFVGVLVGVILTGALRTPHLRTPGEPAPYKNGPGVVRVSVVEGSVVVQRGESRVQTNAVRNAPMLPGDYVSTGNTSRAELQFDGYTAVRLGGSVQARIVDHGANPALQLASGTVEIGMVRDDQAIQIDTPTVTVRAHQAGDSRISVTADGSTWITPRRGSVDVVTQQRTYPIAAGSTLVARGPASNPSISYTSAAAFDSFDDFNAARDKAMLAALNANPNLNPTIAGYENLSDYGHWQAIAGYGQSWVPNEPASWVPYRNGSWAWEGRYGWTWIGDEPWGWTPYHYGNWFYCSCGSSGWAWLPPSSAAKLSWSPALVGFFGFDVASTGGPNNCGGNYGYAPEGSGTPAAPTGNAAPAAAPYGEGGPSAQTNESAPTAPYGEGGPTPYGEGGPGPEAAYGNGPGYSAPYAYPYPYIGWVPIAPYEPFYPWWYGGVGFGFGFGGYGYPGAFATNIVNVTNITNINRIYRNFRHGGATGTTIRHFRHGTVSGHTVAVNRRDIGRRFGTIHGALPIKPTRNNLAFSHGTVHAPVTFAKAFNSPRFALHGMPAARTAQAPVRRGSVPVSRANLATHTNAAMHATERATIGRASAPVSRANAPVSRINAPIAHANAPATRANAFQTRGNPAFARGSSSAPIAREHAATSHQIEATQRTNAPVTRENVAPAARENAAPTMRGENGATMRQAESPRNNFAPSTSWDRFNQGRGEARSAEFPGGPGGAASARDGRGEVSAPSEAGREQRAPSDSWGRFSSSRGESYGGARESYGGARESYGGTRDSYGGMRDPYAERQAMPSYQREPSYSRGSYGSPYSRESYPSYSRGSYPSYSRGSYPSYSRGSYPSYPRGSYGSAPSYPRGNSAPPRPSGGGGVSGGGGERHGGGGRPPN